MALSSESATSPETADRPSWIRIISQQATRIRNLEEENQELKNLVQTLKDEIRRLKGEKSRRSSNRLFRTSPSRIKSCGGPKIGKRGGKPSPSPEQERLPIDPAVLPADARSKGTRRIVIQDLWIEPDHIAFEVERYCSSRERKTYESSLPPAYEGSRFGPGIRHVVLVLHYQGRMPQKLLQTFLTGMGVRIYRLLREVQVVKKLTFCLDHF